MDFAIKHLQKNNAAPPLDNRRFSKAEMPRRQQLVGMVLRLQGFEAGDRRYRLLLESVRQERASRSRIKEGRQVKRLDLRASICGKLAAISRVSRLRESTLVERLISDEAEARGRESVTLKQQRQTIKQDFKRVGEQENELKARGVQLKARETELARQEKSFSRRLVRLAAFDELVNAIMKCKADDLGVKINTDPGGDIKNFLTFSAAGGSSDSVELVSDAWAAFLSQLVSDADQ